VQKKTYFSLPRLCPTWLTIHRGRALRPTGRTGTKMWCSRKRVQRGRGRHDGRADRAQIARDQEHAALEQQRLQQRDQLRGRQLPEQARERDTPPGAIAIRRQRLQLQPPPRAAAPGGSDALTLP